MNVKMAEMVDWELLKTEEGYKLEDCESLVEENDPCKEEGISLCFATTSGLNG